MYIYIYIYICIYIYMYIDDKRHSLTTEQITTHLYFVFALTFSLYLVLQVHITYECYVCFYTFTGCPKKPPKTIESDPLLEFQCLALN